ncbi:malate dehydrogenase (quinone) [Tenacibaculum finnmarkense]|uniref:malate dehydrogenase (quinone) n=1 Tax=Tenacibaculum finnmarkense TaxID=2781243 RepID=UPI001EFC02C5|nr:malate dehydrogenase (quinone) [Tenacibaculum finnmarkense]MCG8806151.1 malate dehydrogenase (quinone) [Tenacibaculum finnmarkense]MCG8857250.1 malate dehydrogenase (quinone) [Tenacibaculum finnmarkense]
MDIKDIEKEYDLICVGGGVMSANLALLAKLLNPEMKILILERLDGVAKESSAAWNNAGTGHSALCELNYCPENDDKSISIEKAVKICSQYEISKQLWAYLVTEKYLENPTDFVTSVKHHSWVTGAENSDYLKRRYQAFKNNFMFDTIDFTQDKAKMKTWFPLIMKDRTADEPMAASRIDRGTEVNYGVLTKSLFAILEDEFDTPVHCNMEVLDVDPDTDLDWTVAVKNTKTDQVHQMDAKHVFIGAGGGSLLLLQKVEIDEKQGYGGFPVSGEWLVCNNENLIKQHDAKVYSKAGIGDPPMSTPHLDTRYIDGKKQLMFGPFAGFSPKFLKEGSNLDLFKSVQFDNISPMLGAFWHNLPLTKYLIEQVMMGKDERMDSLRKFIKNANNDDWDVVLAGQRVQIIKKDEFEGGKLQFGTEVISSKDGSITCLLGASPGASTATAIMLQVLEKAFPELLDTPESRQKLKEIVPFYNTEITKELFDKQLAYCKKALKL